jgi:hypothetical protein
MEQWAAALKKGNEFRLRRAAFKKEMKAGDVRLSEVLSEDIPEWLATEPIGRLIRQMPRWGPSRMRRLLAPLAIREITRTGSLTRRQRLLLKMELERRGL